ncbi:hypothetical protein A4X13_0g8194, partial [Tilletia indica]
MDIDKSEDVMLKHSPVLPPALLLHAAALEAQCTGAIEEDTGLGAMSVAPPSQSLSENIKQICDALHTDAEGCGLRGQNPGQYPPATSGTIETKESHETTMTTWGTAAAMNGDDRTDHTSSPYPLSQAANTPDRATAWGRVPERDYGWLPGDPDVDQIQEFMYIFDGSERMVVPPSSDPPQEASKSVHWSDEDCTLVPPPAGPTWNKSDSTLVPITVQKLPVSGSVEPKMDGEENVRMATPLPMENLTDCANEDAPGDIHRSNKSVKCLDCLKTYEGSAALTYHMKVAHQTSATVKVPGWVEPQLIERRAGVNSKGVAGDFLHCPKCDQGYTSEQTLIKHVNACTHIRPEPTADDAPPTVTLELLKSNIKAKAEEMGNRFKTPTANQLTPWARRNQFARLLDGETLQDYANATDLPTDKVKTQENVLCDATAEAIRKAADKLASLPIFFSQMMNSKDATKTEFTRPMNAQPSTLEGYIKIAQRLMLFHWRLFELNRDNSASSDLTQGGLLKARKALRDD